MASASALARARGTSAPGQSCAAIAALAAAACRSKLDVAPPQRTLRDIVAREDFVDAPAQGAAGLGAEALCVQARLLGQARDRQPRQATRLARRAQSLQQLERAVLGALARGDSRRGAVAEVHGVGQAGALQHVEAVRQQRDRILRTALLPDRGGEQRGEHADERVAAAEIALGRGQRGPQQALGQAHLALPQ
jgi:hypothetical protein